MTSYYDVAFGRVLGTETVTFQQEDHLIFRIFDLKDEQIICHRATDILLCDISSWVLDSARPESELMEDKEKELNLALCYESYEKF